jgi:small subunit ribosomal protein S2
LLWLKSRLKKYLDLIEKRETGKLEKYTKKERLDFDREIKKLEMRVGGLTSLNKLPDALFVWDIKEEETSIKEAQQKNIPIIAVCDTNVNPDEVTYPIPANDDSLRLLKLFLAYIREIFLLVARIQKFNLGKTNKFNILIFNNMELIKQLREITGAGYG